MPTKQSKAKDPVPGQIASLHVHPEQSGAPLLTLDALDLVAGKGIREDIRYFNRKSRRTGQPTRRQVTLIEREQIQEHANFFGIHAFSPGVVRSNIETAAIRLQELLGWEVQVGEAVLFFYESRTPCFQMDRIHPGLQEQMKNGRQGVLAQVVRSGKVRVGDAIQKLRQV